MFIFLCKNSSVNSNLSNLKNCFIFSLFFLIFSNISSSLFSTNLHLYCRISFLYSLLYFSNCSASILSREYSFIKPFCSSSKLCILSSITLFFTILLFILSCNLLFISNILLIIFSLFSNSSLKIFSKIWFSSIVANSVLQQVAFVPYFLYSEQIQNSSFADGLCFVLQ